ncbi:EPC1 protein, partial [Atractosteus spatula]|nr:EPC1 protein [Atractosteus spatula]
MSKLSFRARALDASKPLPVFRCEDLPDLHEYASINRAVPQMPTGMEKEEESRPCFLETRQLSKFPYRMYILGREGCLFLSASAVPRTELGSPPKGSGQCRAAKEKTSLRLAENGHDRSDPG